MSPFLARALSSLGKLYLDTRREAEARAALARAADLFTAMGMARDLARTQVLLSIL